MGIPSEILILIAGIGAIQSTFLAFYILSFNREKIIHKSLLSALFLALAFRVGKSVLWLFWNETPLWILNLGFSAHAAIGPSLLLYTYYYIYQEKRFQKLNLIHFLPTLIIAILASGLKLNSFWYSGGYKALLFHHISYMTASLVVYLNALNNKNLGKLTFKTLRSKWVLSLIIGTSILGLAYFSNYILGLTSYVLGPLLYSAIIYLLSFYCFKNPAVFKKTINTSKPKYKNLNISATEAEAYKDKLLKVMQIDKPFLDADFSLSKLSSLISIPNYTLSHIINDVIQQNFSDFTNYHRIKEAQVKLSDPKNHNLKIASIAYDCGFNSLSSFNTAFKKFTNMTPSQYKNQQSIHK